METILQEIRQQPDALQSLAKYYTSDDGRALLDSVPAGSNPLFLGSGANYYSAEIAVLHCNRFGKTAHAIEAENLAEMPLKLLEQYDALICISPTGEDEEILQFLDKLDPARLVTLTNAPKSSLALAAKVFLPLCAGDESLEMSKTYVNSLALLWLLVRGMCRQLDGSEKKQIEKIRKRVQLILDGSAAVVEPWQALMDEVGPILFLGHGEHAASAQLASLLLAKWAKRFSQSGSFGSFKHGLVELSEPGVGAILFASAATGLTRELEVAGELDNYGVNVLLTVDGNPRRLAESMPGPGGFDPMLSVLLDALPAQIWAADLVQRFLPGDVKNRSKKAGKRN